MSTATAEAPTESGVLTAETLPAYLVEHQFAALRAKLGLSADIDATAFVVTPILGGNVNYAFCVTTRDKNSSSGLQFFVKQAPEYVAIFGPDGLPLSSQRMQRELDVYREWETILMKDDGNKTSKYLPTIYFFDPKHMVVGMEFLDGYELLDHVLVDDTTSTTTSIAAYAQPLGDFMGRIHAATHASQVESAERKAYLVEHFENRPMRDIQLEFVFTKCYSEATDEQRVGLHLTEAFLKEVELLKQQYNGNNDNLVLCHGDLHPGSVMVSSSTNDVRIIDPEFTVYGPPGLDVGSLLSGYCLGAIHQAFTKENVGSSDVADAIVSSVADIWSAYVQAFTTSTMENGTASTIIKDTEIETVGFTVAEVCRTALGFAGGRKWLQFLDDEAQQAAAHKVALELVDACMVARHSGGMPLLLEELRKAVAKGKAYGIEP